MSGFLVFDMETRVDKELVRDSYREKQLSPEAAYERMRARLEEEGRGFFPIPFHVPISIVWMEVDADYGLPGFYTLGSDVHGDEAIIRDFWERLESFDGTVVTFNGRGFDLPVLELQALRHGIGAPRSLDERSGLRRRGGRHLDLMDFVSNQGVSRVRGGLHLLSRLIGIPGKGGVSGEDVQGLWEAARYEEIHRYCRRDVICTYFLLLRVERLRGRLSAAELERLEEAAAELRAELGGSPG